MTTFLLEEQMAFGFGSGKALIFCKAKQEWFWKKSYPKGGFSYLILLIVFYGVLQKMVRIHLA